MQIKSSFFLARTQHTTRDFDNDIIKSQYRPDYFLLAFQWYIRVILNSIAISRQVVSSFLYHMFWQENEYVQFFLLCGLFSLISSRTNNIISKKRYLLTFYEIENNNNSRSIIQSIIQLPTLSIVTLFKTRFNYPRVCNADFPRNICL